MPLFKINHKTENIMDIKPLNITIRDLVARYEDRGDEGVVGYGGLLDIRPSYQREFVYDYEKQVAVIDSVMHGYPLNAMYWTPKDGGGYEVLDGQQRTLSICEFAAGNIDYKKRYIHRMLPDEIERFYDYKLLVFVVFGTPSERLKWFETINIGGLVLTPQELRNAVYAGPWVNDAKRYFSKRGAPAPSFASNYVSGDAKRQEYLEEAIRWASGASTDADIRDYMNEHAGDASANYLWLHFQTVINWVKAVFPTYHSFMKGLPWGDYYRKWKEAPITKENPAAIEDRVKKLILDDDVKNSGIYAYLLSGEEKYLHIRAFSQAMRIAAYERQGGYCKVCGKHFDISEMEADHITPWSQGGPTSAENCQMLCRDCNRHKSDK